MDCSLLIQTCDGYQRFWTGMLFSLDINWDFDKVPVYWSSEEISINDTDIICRGREYKSPKINSLLVGKTDKDGFSNRMIESLKQIPTKWVIYLQEDMWLFSNPDFNTLEKLISFAETNNVDSIKIHTKLQYYDKYKLEPTNHIIDNVLLLKYSDGENFLHSHNGTIWNKEYLLNNLVYGEDPWKNEIEGSKRMSKNPHNHYHYNIFWYSQPGVCDFGNANNDFDRLAPILEDIIELKLIMEDFKNIDEQRKWNDDSWWAEGGHEWSKSFGTTEDLWNKHIFEDIKEFRNKKILEIGPGHGRMTQFLSILASELLVVDLNENCIKKTKEKLGHHVLAYFTNNGNDLPNIRDNSQDLVFSFDSFVHMHKNVIDDYIGEIYRVLKPGGKSFIHHSWLMGGEDNSFLNVGGRASMTPEIFKSLVEKHNMKIVEQKTIKFESVGLWDGTDSITIFEK
jgi:SAM-dependent methyltransferase